MTAVTPKATPQLSTPDLALVLFCTIDDLYRDLVPDSVRLRPGHQRMALTDAEVLTLSVLQEARSNDSETSFVRQMRRDHTDLFPGLLSTSRYHRRRKALVGVQQALFAHLAGTFTDAARWLVVDSAPVETTKVERSQTGAKSIPEAAYHVRAARKQLFFGFRLHVTVTDAGAVVVGPCVGGAVGTARKEQATGLDERGGRSGPRGASWNGWRTGPRIEPSFGVLGFPEPSQALG